MQHLQHSRTLVRVAVHTGTVSRSLRCHKNIFGREPAGLELAWQSTAIAEEALVYSDGLAGGFVHSSMMRPVAVLCSESH